MKHIYTFLTVLLLATLQVYAQNDGTITIKGSVKDSANEAVVGAVVMLEGSDTVAVVTDIDGSWTLAVPKNATLNVSCLSYKTQSVEVAGRSVIDVVLESEQIELDEVVVVGYGSMRRSDITGSVTSVKIDEDKASRSGSIDQLLSGAAAGVQVVSNGGAPDSGMAIRIRGVGSFNSSAAPLFVVDGIIMNSPTSTENLLTQDAGNSDEESNGLLGLNTQDIESMEILKDASATAIYGALGANGVVLITTKSAKREKPTIRATVGVDIAHRYKKMDVLDFDEYVSYLQQVKPENLMYIYEDPANLEGLKVTPMDWQDYMMRAAIGQRYYLSIAGKPNTLTYNTSFGYTGRQGIMKGTQVEQFTFRTNLKKEFNKKVSAGLNVNFAHIDSDMGQSASSSQISQSSSMVRSMLSYKPYINQVSTEEDDYYEEEGTPEDESFIASPDKWRTDFLNKRSEFRITPSAYLEWKITPWIIFKSTFGGDYKNNERAKFKTRNINRNESGSLGAIANIENLTYNFDNMLMFNRKFFGGHNLSGTLGMSAYRTGTYTQTIEGWNIEQFKALENSLNTAPNTRIAYSEIESSTLSWFLRAVYSFKDRYVLTGTYRIDGSSKFQGKNKFAHFPSFAFAWRFTEEPWFDADFVSNGKLRLGWGQVGNQAISAYRTLSNYSSGKVPSHSVPDAEAFIGLFPSNLANPDLKWETTEQYNVGLDAGFWNGRVTLTVDAYHKLTKDLLQTKRISSSSGYTSIWVNEGSISNSGIELSLEAVPVSNRRVEWSVGGNISFNKNKIVSIDRTAAKDRIYTDKSGNTTDAVYFLGSSIGSGSLANFPANIFIEGQPLGLFYVWPTDGIVPAGMTGVPIGDGKERTPEGSINYLDMNGNGYIDNEDRTICGNPNPDFIYGLNSSLSYKNFSFNIGFTGSYGNDILNVNAISEDNICYYKQNHSARSYHNAWTPENPTNYPSLSASKNEDRVFITDRFIEDGSFLRLSNLSMSYTFKFKKKAVRNITLTAAAKNLYVWTKYSGWDPEVNSYGNNVLKMGLDVGSYPTARTFSFDVKFTF